MTNSAKLAWLLGTGISTLFFSLTSVCIANPVNAMMTHIEKNIPGDNHASSNMLYALSAESGTFENNKLTLRGVKVVIYFTEAPKRIAGQLSLAKFDDIWNKQIVSNKTEKPNAVLSLLSEQGNNNVIVELKSQSLKGDTLTYKVNLLQGKLTNSFGNATLFIDGFPCRVNGC